MSNATNFPGFAEMMRRLIMAKNRKPRNFKHFCWRQFFLILDGLETLSLAWKSPIQFGSSHVGQWMFFKHSGRRQLYHLSAESSSLFVSSLEINSYKSVIIFYTKSPGSHIFTKTKLSLYTRLCNNVKDFKVHFWKLLRPPLIQFSKYNNFLSVCWFLCQKPF